jgi:hypothetical protein
MALDNIQLNFINQSEDTNNSSIVIFQKNVAEDYNEIAVAWTVIENCGRLDNHPFLYPLQFQVSSSDSYGNFTPMLDAADGQAFEMTKTDSGDVLQLATPPAATSPFEVEIQNNLTMGSISGNITKDGKVLSTKTNIVPGQKAAFQFHPTIWIGAVSQITQGQIMDSAIIQQINTELPLYGISSADIVMTGGGSGKSSSPFKFQLANQDK